MQVKFSLFLIRSAPSYTVKPFISKPLHFIQGNVHGIILIHGSKFVQNEY